MKIILTNFNGVLINDVNVNALSKRAQENFKKLCKNNAERAVQCAIGDLLLKNELQKLSVFNYEICENQNGKPYLLNNELNFNLTHQNTVTAIAVCDTEVGLDVQKLDDEKITLNLLTTVLNELELKTYNDLPSNAEKVKYFYRCFTEKEAFVKMKGDFLPYPPSSIKSYPNAKFVTKYLFLDNCVYCLTVCAQDIKSINFEIVDVRELLKL